jgi:uncharacterized tellurite resistance protein B-like protein
MTGSGDAFEKRRQALEEEFFKKHNAKLAAELKGKLARKQTREELVELTGIHDEAVLDALLALGLDKSTFVAFGLFPLVEVAWADGEVDAQERKAVLAAAAEQGILPGSDARTALEGLLAQAPSETARKAWHAWAGELARKLGPAERSRARRELVARARAVAEASGGILGLGRKVSAREQAVLEAIEQAFPD